MKRRVGILFAAVVLGLAAAPSAHAVFIMSAQVDFATSPITVGSSGAGTIAFSNNSNAAEVAIIIDRIVLEPSCRNPGESPPCTNREPGIFSIGNGTGVLGTTCQGITFDVTAGAPPFLGSLEFTPQTEIPDMPAGTTCAINFSYTALAVPAVDTQPAEPGIDTDQAAVVRADSGGGPIPFGPATDFTAVNPAPPLTNPPVTTPSVTTPPTPTAKKCKKGQKLKKGKCVKKKRKK